MQEEWHELPDKEMVTVAAGGALQSGRMLCTLWDGMSADQRALLPKCVKEVMQPGSFRTAFDQFVDGQLNPATQKPYPLRKPE